MLDLAVIFRTQNDKGTIIEKVNKVLNSGLQNYDLIVIDDFSNDNTLDKLLLFEDKTRIEIVQYENSSISILNSAGYYRGNSSIPRQIVGHANVVERGIGKNFDQGIDWAERDNNIKKFLIINNFLDLDKIEEDFSNDVKFTKNYIVITKRTRNAIGMFDPDIKTIDTIAEYINRANIAEMKVEVKNG